MYYNFCLINECYISRSLCYKSMIRNYEDERVMMNK